MFDTSHIHPMLVHFPIALTLIGVLFATLRFYKPEKFHYPCGEIILYFATFSAILAATAGGVFTPNFTQPELVKAVDMHSGFAGVTIIFLCMATLFYAGRYRFKEKALLLQKIGLGFYVLAALSVSVTGFLGGVLVYNDLMGKVFGN